MRTKKLSYQERCNLSTNNPVLVDRYFQYKFDVFFKEIILHGPLGKTKYCYTYRSSHQRCSVRKDVLRNFAKFTGKHLWQGLYFNKVAGLRPETFLK